MDAELQTPAVETPVAPPLVETPAPKSELQAFREKKAAPVEPIVEPTVETPPAEPAPVEAPEPPPTLAAEHVVEHEGVKYDKRTRAGKEIVKLKGVLKASEARIYELQDQLRRTQPAPKVETPKAEPATDASDPEPTLEAFADQADPYLAYTRSLARWEARQEHKQQEEKRAAADRVRQQEDATTKAQAEWDAKLPEVKQRYPDFDTAYDAVFDSLASVAQTGDKRHRYLVHRLLTSEHGHELTYFLGKHPDEVSRLYQVRGFDEHVLAIGRLEERVIAGLTKAPAVTHPTTPAAPMTPVGGGATTTTYDPKTANLAQFRAQKQRFGLRG